MITDNKLDTSKKQHFNRQFVSMAGFWIFVFVFTWLFVSTATAGMVTDENVAVKIEAAHTVADHRALETYFTGKAAEAAKQIRLHEEMMQAYKRRPKSDGLATQMRSHCLKLIRAAGETSDNYKHLAMLHDELSKELAK